MLFGGRIESRRAVVDCVFDVGCACRERIGMTTDDRGNALCFTFKRRSQNIAAFSELACEGRSLLIENIAHAFADRSQIIADLGLRFIDHGAEGSTATGEGFCNLTGASNEVFIDLARTGFESCIQLFGAAVERMSACFELGQQRTATLIERRVELRQTCIEFADHRLGSTAEQGSNASGTLIESRAYTFRNVT